MKTTEEILTYLQDRIAMCEVQITAWQKQKGTELDEQYEKIYNSTDMTINGWEKLLKESKDLIKYITRQSDEEEW